MHLNFSSQKNSFRIAYFAMSRDETGDCGKKLEKQIYLDSYSKIKSKIKIGY